MGNVRKKSRNKSTALVGVLPQQLRHLPKPREGFLPFAEPFFDLYAANEEQLRITGTPPDALREELAAYQELLTTEAALKKQLEVVQETRLLRGSAVWVGILDLYALAKAAARHDVAMQHAIADFERFMKTGPRPTQTIASPATTT